MIDVGMLSIREDFAGIESISFLTSSTVGGSGSRKGSPLKVPSDRRALISTPASLAAMATLTERILLTK